MGEVLPLPSRGDVFADSRAEGRTLRVSWHEDEHTLVLSLWQLGQCRATFRLPSGEVPALVHALVSGLSDSLAAERTGIAPTQPTALRGGPLVPERPAGETPVAAPIPAPEAAADADAVADDQADAAQVGPVTDQGPIPRPVDDSDEAEGSTAPPAVFLAPPNPAL
jgi:hypothetical protein